MKKPLRVVLAIIGGTKVDISAHFKYFLEKMLVVLGKMAICIFYVCGRIFIQINTMLNLRENIFPHMGILILLGFTYKIWVKIITHVYTQ